MYKLHNSQNSQKLIFHCAFVIAKPIVIQRLMGLRREIGTRQSVYFCEWRVCVVQYWRRGVWNTRQKTAVNCMSASPNRQDARLSSAASLISCVSPCSSSSSSSSIGTASNVDCTLTSVSLSLPHLRCSISYQYFTQRTMYRRSCFGLCGPGLGLNLDMQLRHNHVLWHCLLYMHRKSSHNLTPISALVQIIDSIK